MKASILSGLLILCTTFNVTSQLDQKGPLKRTFSTLQVYYESGCPYCNEFFGTILRPAYDSIKSILHLELVPYGNAQHFYWDKYDHHAFVCQHGIEECATNMFQACALASNSTSYEQQVTLLLCIMGYSPARGSGFTGWEFCSTLADVDYDVIYSCYNSRDGEQALLRMANATAALPDYQGTPWVVLNGNDGLAMQNALTSSIYSFERTVCKSVDEAYRPPVCQGF